MTAANVVPGSNGEFLDVIAGGAITAGQAAYRDPSTGKYLPGKKGASAAGLCVGIAVDGAAGINQPCRLQTGGDMVIGATVAIGVVYIPGTASGGICPTADATTGDYVSILALGISTTTLRVFPILHNGVPNA